MKKHLPEIIMSIIFLGIIFIILWITTSPACWYAGMHDAKCEGENCHCYERFITADRN